MLAARAAVVPLVRIRLRRVARATPRLVAVAVVAPLVAPRGVGPGSLIHAVASVWAVVVANAPALGVGAFRLEAPIVPPPTAIKLAHPVAPPAAIGALSKLGGWRRAWVMTVGLVAGPPAIAPTSVVARPVARAAFLARAAPMDPARVAARAPHVLLVAAAALTGPPVVRLAAHVLAPVAASPFVAAAAPTPSVVAIVVARAMPAASAVELPAPVVKSAVPAAIIVAPLVGPRARLRRRRRVSIGTGVWGGPATFGFGVGAKVGSQL